MIDFIDWLVGWLRFPNAVKIAAEGFSSWYFEALQSAKE
jgi:hypothetical protein